ncbi:MAG: hypothetical protein A2511_16645 [Deltaproteobacteria bacterium RIFOXYD12_FULL_50_9]|nr:MAG: hypothetical protein A2511_16645 [Deltaproteobacteria bacterium RIFOXYD12_FULL_50_9]
MNEHPDLSKHVFQFSPEIDKLAVALAKAQGEFNHAKKTELNKAPNLQTKYASLADVTDCIKQPLSENGITYLQPVSMTDTGVSCVFTILIHESGQWILSVLPVPQLEVKGINELQTFGLAVTYLRRYMLSSMLGIATEDDDAVSAGVKDKGRSSSDPSLVGSQKPKPALQGNASKGALPATQEKPPSSANSPASDNTTNQDGLPTLGGVTYNQVNGEIHAVGKGSFDHKETLKACGFSFRSDAKAWVKKAA